MRPEVLSRAFKRSVNVTDVQQQLQLQQLSIASRRKRLKSS